MGKTTKHSPGIDVQSGDENLIRAHAQAILDHARDAIVSIDARGVVIGFNREAERMFGYSASKALGSNVGLLMPSPYRERHDGYMQAYQTTGQAKAIGRIREVEGLRKNGEVFPIELSVAEVTVGEGEEPLYTAVIRDVSVQRHAAEKLRKANMAMRERERLADLGAIAAKLVHDLANPLSGLSMQVQNLLYQFERSGSPSRERLLTSLGRIKSASETMAGLIRNLMDFAREQKLEKRSVDLRVLLAGVVDLLGPVAADANSKIELIAPEELHTIACDEEKLRRVFDNLVRNSVDALSAQGGGQIRVEVSETSANRMRICVEDDGPGVADGVDVFRLFETTKHGGTGIGLAVAKQIVIAHGGSVEHLRPERGGAAFIVELPID